MCQWPWTSWHTNNVRYTYARERGGFQLETGWQHKVHIWAVLEFGFSTFLAMFLFDFRVFLFFTFKLSNQSYQSYKLILTCTPWHCRTCH